MMKNLFVLLQSITIIFPIGVFFTYIFMDGGDQFTYEHYLMTSLSAFPFFMVLLIKYFISGFDKK